MNRNKTSAWKLPQKLPLGHPSLKAMENIGEKGKRRGEKTT